MDYRQVEYFLCTSHHRSFSKAAQKLYVSQQALSKTIQELEAELGCILFERTARGVKLTSQGKQLQSLLEPAYLEFQNALKNAQVQLTNRKTTLTLGAAPLVMGILNWDLLYGFKKEHSGIELEIVQLSDPGAEAWIEEEDQNIALMAKPEKWFDPSVHPLILKRLPLMAVVYKDHPLAGRQKISFDELKNEQFLVLNDQSYQRKIIESEAAKYGFQPKIGFVSTDVNQLCGLAQQKKGILIATASPAFGTLFSDLKVIALDDPDFNYCIALICKNPKRLGPQGQALMKYLRKECAEYISYKTDT